MFKKLTDQGVRAAPAARVPDEIQRTQRLPERGGNGGRLSVGSNIHLKGAAIEDCDTLFVEGRVEASIDSRLIQIAESGVFLGAASVDEAEIHGRFDGDLTVRERLVIHKTGRVCGTVRYGRLEIEEGGEIAGEIAATKEPGETGERNPAGALQRMRNPAPKASATQTLIEATPV